MTLHEPLKVMSARTEIMEKLFTTSQLLILTLPYNVVDYKPRIMHKLDIVRHFSNVHANAIVEYMYT